MSDVAHGPLVFFAGFISSPHQAVGEYQHPGPHRHGGNSDESIHATLQGKSEKTTGFVGGDTDDVHIHVHTGIYVIVLQKYCSLFLGIRYKVRNLIQKYKVL